MNLTKNEALKAAIDGNKIKCESWLNKNKYIEWQKHRFVVRVFGYDDQQDACDSIALYNNDDWEIILETVDFSTAWQAYEEGKTIRSLEGDSEYFLSEGIVDAFTTQQIRGKWIIWEDNND